MSDVQRLTKDIFFKSISNVAVIFLGLATSVLLNRYFGKNSYGLLVLVFTVTGFVSSFSGLGSLPTLNRYIPAFTKSEKYDKHSEVFHLIITGFIFQMLGLIIFGIAIFFATDYIALTFFKKEEMIPLLRIGVFYFIGFCLVNFTFQVFQGFQKWKKESILSFIYPLLYLILMLIFFFAFKSNNLTSVLYCNIYAAVTTITLALTSIPKETIAPLFRKISFHKIIENSKRIKTFGIPLLINEVNFFAVMWFDKLILGKYRSTEEITYYYIAFAFVNALTILFKVLTTVLMPYIATIEVTDYIMIQRKFRLIFRWFMHLAIVVSLPTFFLIKPLITLLYGSDYAPAITAFRLLLAVFILRALLNPCGMFLVNVFNKTKHSAALGTCLSVTTIALNLIFIPKYGFIGAAVANLIAYCFYLVIFIGSLDFFRKMTPFKDLIKVSIVISLILVANFLFVQIDFNNIYFRSFFCLLLYILLIKVFNGIELKDIELVKEILKSLRLRKPIYDSLRSI